LCAARLRRPAAEARGIDNESFVSVRADALPSSSAQAFEQGVSIYPKGFAGFMSGFVPPQPGHFVLSSYYPHFNATTGAIVRDGEVELGVDLKMDAIFMQGLYVTPSNLFGGNHSFGGSVVRH
jgi:hypothetical protein